MNINVSYISFRLNSYPEDIITVGLIMECDGLVKMKISDIRMKSLKKIIPKHIYNFYNDTLKNLNDYSDKLDIEYINHLHCTHNGLLKISKPVIFSINDHRTFDECFESFFEKRIDRAYCL